MMLNVGKLYFVFIASVVLSCITATIIASRYRRRMQQLMRAPCREDSRLSNGPAAELTPDRPAGASVSLADNRAAGMRLTILLIGSSSLLAATSASIFCALMFPDDPLMPWRVIPIAMVQLWPVIPAIALMWRWSGARFAAALLLWCTVMGVVLFGIGLWRQIDMGPLLLLKIMASEIGLTLVLLLLVFLGNATRAIAPWLLMPSALLVSSLLAGLDVLTSMAHHESPLLKSLIAPLEGLPGWNGVVVVFGLVLLIAGFIAWWPVRVLGRALGSAYSRKWFSDLLAMYTAFWAFSLTDKALTVATQASAGAAAVAMYLPLLWIPMVIWPAARWRPRCERPPTLLVLRVFQQDAQARSVFDHVVERWRLSGNVVMIAGTDLADRTLDADDIFQFLDGKLAQRFIVSPMDVARRIGAFDMAADIDGRYRVNECYCHDTTWQDALQALVRCSDVVLMDLRGFRAHNAGCRYELATLARASRTLRVVVLTDGRTDLPVAQETAASGRSERFTWIEVSDFSATKLREVLTHLFA